MPAFFRIVVCLAAAALALPTTAFDLQGHRGARGLAPENSLRGFELAIEQGVTTLETDAAITRDGVIVLHHDRALNPNVARDASGRWLHGPAPPIHRMTLAEVRSHDIGRIKPGTRYAADHPDQVPRDGTRVPRLAELFEMVKAGRHDHVRFAIEIKTSPLAPGETLPPAAFARALVDEVRAAGMQHRVQIMSFDWRALQAVQRIAPATPTVYLSAQQRWIDNIGAGQGQDSPWVAGFTFGLHGSVPAMVKAAGGQVWSAYHGDLDADKVRQAQALGLKVLAWTVNDGPTIDKVVDMGVDGLITDRPDIATRALAARGIVPR